MLDYETRNRTDQTRTEQITDPTNGKLHFLFSQQDRSEQIRLHQISSDQNRTNRTEQIRTDQLRTEQIRLHQLSSDQNRINRTDQIRTDHDPCSLADPTNF